MPKKPTAPAAPKKPSPAKKPAKLAPKKPAPAKQPAAKAPAPVTPRAAVKKKAPPAKPPIAKKPTVKKVASGGGTAATPWTLKTPPGSSEFVAYRDETAVPPAVVVKVGSTELRYHLRAIDDLHAWLRGAGDWVSLGGADEQKPAPAGSVEAWGRAADNPVGGWYGLKKGLRGRFGVYLPPVLEALGLAEVEHLPRNNRMRAR